MSYTRVNWQDAPSVSTPLSASNLNKMDAGIEQNANDIEALQQHTYDSALDDTSTNAPQTKVVKKAIEDAVESVTIITDPTLSNEGQAADAKATGDAVANVKNALDVISENCFNYDAIIVDDAPTGYRLNESDGLCTANASYKLVKYAVTPGEYIKVVSDDRFQFQNAKSVPSSGTSNRIGRTYGAGTFYVVAPVGATYLIVSTTVSGSSANAYLASSVKDDISDILRTGSINYGAVANGSIGASGITTGASNRIRTQLIPIVIGDVIDINPGSLVYACGIWNGSVSRENNVRNDTNFLSNGEVLVSAYNGYLAVAFRNSGETNLTPSDFDGYVRKYPPMIYALHSALEYFKTSPITFVDGKYYNIRDHKLDDDDGYEYVKLNVSPFRGGNIKGQTAVAPNSHYGVAFVDSNDGFISGHYSTNTGYFEYAYDLTIPENATYFYISHRKASTGVWQDPVYPWEYGMFRLIAQIPDGSTIGNNNVNSKLLNARHVKTTDAAPLTLLHFSDLHADKGALSRIVGYSKKYGTKVADIICTGDIVANEAEQISSWWDEDVLTCIGNHDSASYSGGVYDWTSLSMADRDAYYIAPFESNWGITHTAGTSYYYKDYTAQHVRMIVLDAMLYVGTPGAEATAQTAWLANLLSDAITNNLHVLIAVHAPHGGATAKVCSFSRYGQGIMPTLADCNTPQTVIDAVATAITNGLHFIGYIVGHTHQDNMWDATGDGTQMMYCVTCAAVSQAAQWVNYSDMHRDEQHDAFNLVTIDTTNTLVKIVRGGGADIDDHMRTRKAICFNYSTGTVVGEVL